MHSIVCCPIAMRYCHLPSILPAMAKPESCTGGFLGVNMFLVLSGYLTYKTSVWDQKIQMQYLLKLKWKEILAYDFLCGIFRWSKTGFEGHLWIYCVWIVGTWNSCRTMVALFGTIGNSNTSCRQVATQEQMDRFWKTLYQFSLQINFVHRFMV